MPRSEKVEPKRRSEGTGRFPLAYFFPFVCFDADGKKKKKKTKQNAGPPSAVLLRGSLLRSPRCGPGALSRAATRPERRRGGQQQRGEEKRGRCSFDVAIGFESPLSLSFSFFSLSADYDDVELDGEGFFGVSL